MSTGSCYRWEARQSARSRDEMHMYLHKVDARSGVAMKQVVCAGLLGFVILLVLVEAGLQAGDKECGQIKCTSMQFCDTHGTCDDCARICDSSKNNYDQKTCEEQCQGTSVMLHVISYEESREKTR